MMHSKLHIASISDIHLGHRRNTTLEIITNLKQAFPDNAETADLDIIFICGDVFDDLLILSDEDVLEIDTWIASFLRLCKKHDITLLVLEGTPSHDRGQSIRFPAINEFAQIGAKLTYVKDLTIEYIEEYGITVLCVPDEFRDTTDKTLSHVRELMQAKGLEQVDFAIMHGSFDYQLPANVKSPKHDSRTYLDLVRHFIFIGHIHVHSRYERIIAQGSFDRLSHGEEGPKGHVRAIISNQKPPRILFIENTNAKRFVTVNCEGLNLEETLLEFDKKIQDLPEGSYVRIEASSDNPIFTNMDVVVRKYPFYVWSKLAREEEEEDKQEVYQDEILYTPITITKDNISNLLLDRTVKHNLDSSVLAAANRILEEVI